MGSMFSGPARGLRCCATTESYSFRRACIIRCCGFLLAVPARCLAGRSKKAGPRDAYEAGRSSTGEGHMEIAADIRRRVRPVPERPNQQMPGPRRMSSRKHRERRKFSGASSRRRPRAERFLEACSPGDRSMWPAGRWKGETDFAACREGRCGCLGGSPEKWSVY